LLISGFQIGGLCENQGAGALFAPCTLIFASSSPALGREVGGWGSCDKGNLYIHPKKECVFTYFEKAVSAFVTISDPFSEKAYVIIFIQSSRI
jgi:hypothetical protein